MRLRATKYLFLLRLHPLQLSLQTGERRCGRDRHRQDARSGSPGFSPEAFRGHEGGRIIRTSASRHQRARYSDSQVRRALGQQVHICKRFSAHVVTHRQDARTSWIHRGGHSATGFIPLCTRRPLHTCFMVQTHCYLSAWQLSY